MMMSFTSPIDALADLASLLLLTFAISLVLLILFTRKKRIASSDESLREKLMTLRSRLVLIDRSIETAHSSMQAQSRMSKNTSDLIARNDGLLPDMANKIRETVMRGNALIHKVDAFDNSFTDEKLRLSDLTNLSNITEPFYDNISSRYNALMEATDEAIALSDQSKRINEGLTTIEFNVRSLEDEVKRVRENYPRLSDDLSSRKAKEKSLQTLLSSREKRLVKDDGLLRRYATLTNRSNRIEIVIIDPTQDDYFKESYELDESGKRVIEYGVFRDGCWSNDKTHPIMLVFIPNLLVKKPKDLPNVSHTEWPYRETLIGVNGVTYVIGVRWTSATTNATDFYIVNNIACTTNMHYYNHFTKNLPMPHQDIGIMSFQYISKIPSEEVYPSNKLTFIIFRSIQWTLKDIGPFLLENFETTIDDVTRDYMFVGLVKSNITDRQSFAQQLESKQSGFRDGAKTRISINTADPPETFALAYKALPFYAGTAPLEYYGYGKDKKTFVFRVVTDRPYI